MLSFDPRKCSRKKIWLTMSQVDEMTNLLRVVFQKHEDELMGSLEFNRYQYGAVFMTFANPVSECFGAVKADYIPEQHGVNVLLENEICAGYRGRSPPSLVYSKAYGCW